MKVKVPPQPTTTVNERETKVAIRALEFVKERTKDQTTLNTIQEAIDKCWLVVGRVRDGFW